jgi:hypothetical protein
MSSFLLFKAALVWAVRRTDLETVGKSPLGFLRLRTSFLGMSPDQELGKFGASICNGYGNSQDFQTPARIENIAPPE